MTNTHTYTQRKNQEKKFSCDEVKTLRSEYQDRIKTGESQNKGKISLRKMLWKQLCILMLKKMLKKKIKAPGTCEAVSEGLLYV